MRRWRDVLFYRRHVMGKYLPKLLHYLEVSFRQSLDAEADLGKFAMLPSGEREALLRLRELAESDTRKDPGVDVDKCLSRLRKWAETIRWPNAGGLSEWANVPLLYALQIMP